MFERVGKRVGEGVWRSLWLVVQAPVTGGGKPEEVDTALEWG